MENRKISIRYSKPEDFDFLIKGLEETRRLERRPRKEIRANARDFDEYRTAIPLHLIRVVEDRGKPIAFLYFRTDFRVMYIRKRVFWVDLVFVDRKHREKGIGRLLYKDAVSIAKKKGYKTLVIDIFEANRGSKVFHSSLGFKPLYTIYQKGT